MPTILRNTFRSSQFHMWVILSLDESVSYPKSKSESTLTSGSIIQKCFVFDIDAILDTAASTLGSDQSSRLILTIRKLGYTSRISSNLSFVSLSVLYVR